MKVRNITVQPLSELSSVLVRVSVNEKLAQHEPQGKPGLATSAGRRAARQFECAFPDICGSSATAWYDLKEGCLEIKGDAGWGSEDRRAAIKQAIEADYSPPRLFFACTERTLLTYTIVVSTPGHFTDHDLIAMQALDGVMRVRGGYVRQLGRCPRVSLFMSARASRQDLEASVSRLVC